jgi:hypothetical protein
MTAAPLLKLLTVKLVQGPREVALVEASPLVQAVARAFLALAFLSP